MDEINKKVVKTEVIRRMKYNLRKKSNSRHLKFISFSINNRLGNFKQFTIIIEMI